jgi:tetratricopeptide (TPR) repeat protein
MDLPARKGSELPRRSYSDEEIVDIYELGRLWLETGQHRRAEAIMAGLNEVAPQFAPAWLGTAFLRGIGGNYDGALQAAKNALRSEPESVEAMLYITTMCLTTGDFSTAGTYLGEVGERIEQGKITNPNVTRFFKMQLARYQSRS